METTLRENRAAQQAADLNRISAVILIAAAGCYVLLYILLGMLALWFWKAVSLVFSCAFAAALVFALLSLRKKRTTRGIVLAAVSALLFLLSFVPLADGVLAESRKESLEIYCTYKRLEGEYRYVVDSVAYPQSYKLGQVGVGQEMDIIFKTKRLYDSFVRDTARCPGCIHFVFTGNLKPPNRSLLEVTDYRIIKKVISQAQEENREPYRVILLKSIGQEQNFEVRIAFADEELKSAYAIYSGERNAYPLSSTARK